MDLKAALPRFFRPLVVASLVSLGGIASVNAMPRATVFDAASHAGLQSVQYRDWDGDRDFRRDERHREFRRWEREREFRRWERHRRFRDWERRQYGY